MIRNVVVGRLRPGVAPEHIEPGLQALRDLTVAGCPTSSDSIRHETPMITKE